MIFEKVYLYIMCGCHILVSLWSPLNQSWCWCKLKFHNYVGILNYASSKVIGDIHLKKINVFRVINVGDWSEHFRHRMSWIYLPFYSQSCIAVIPKICWMVLMGQSPSLNSGGIKALNPQKIMIFQRYLTNCPNETETKYWLTKYRSHF